MIPVVLFAIGLLVRAAVGTAFAGPAYPDSYYYTNVAQALAAGHGFTVDYIWNFVDVGGVIPQAPTLPIPSNGHWMPLAALVQVPFIWALGATWLASELPMWIIGAVAAPLTYWIARDAGLDSRLAVCAGLLAAVPGALTPFFGQPDNFGLFMVLGALALWLCAKGLSGNRRAFVAGGLVVGLATLARSDAVLLGVTFALAFARELWLTRGRSSTIGWTAAIGCVGLFAIVVGPWLYRQLEVFGSFAPSAANGRILWISSYDQLYSVGSPATPATLFSDGIGPVIASRISGFAWAIGLFAFLPLTVVLAPVAVAGAWLRRRDGRFAPFFVYALLLFAANGLVFAVHVPHGTFMHSAVALLPHTFVLVMIGVRGAVEWAARRRPWDVERATRLFAAGSVAVAVIGAVFYSSATLGHWSDVRTTQAELAADVVADPAASPSDVVMSADAGAYRYLTGHPGIVTPFDDMATIEQAMREYNVRWLILERAQIVPALEPVLLGTARPDWLSRPVAVVPAGDAQAIATTGPVRTGVPDGALYAVCLDAQDMRCQ
jgi:hypothetical protein